MNSVSGRRLKPKSTQGTLDFVCLNSNKTKKPYKETLNCSDDFSTLPGTYGSLDIYNPQIHINLF